MAVPFSFAAPVTLALPRNFNLINYQLFECISGYGISQIPSLWTLNESQWKHYGDNRN